MELIITTTPEYITGALLELMCHVKMFESFPHDHYSWLCGRAFRDKWYEWGATVMQRYNLPGPLILEPGSDRPFTMAGIVAKVSDDVATNTANLFRGDDLVGAVTLC